MSRRTIELATAVAVVLLGALAPPALAGRAYTANELDNSVSVVNTTTNQTVGQAIHVGQFPRAVAITPSVNKIYVANRGSDNVSVIKASTKDVIKTIHVGGQPRALCVSPDGTRVYVANRRTDNVSVIGTVHNHVVDTINVGRAPFGIVASPDGNRVYVNNNDDETVSVIRTSTNHVIGSPIHVGSGP
jgi:YVTN family beta-propeller protein